MRKDREKIQKLREISSIAVTKACYLAIFGEISKRADDELAEKLADLKKSIVACDFYTADDIIRRHFRQMLHPNSRNGASLLASQLGVTRQCIAAFIKKRALIPAPMAKDLQSLVPISASELRPDIF